jgi:phage terminase large subunit-like protein
MSSTLSTPNSPPYIVDGKTDAERYLEDCLDNKIIVCDKVKKFADIMLPRINDGYKQWHLDVDAALRPVSFLERFCRIPSGKKSSQPFVLEAYERMPVELAFGFVDDDGNRQIKEVFIQWARKCGKALSLDTDIPTPDGWRTMRDIHQGDFVFGIDGKPSRVLVESEVFHKPMYLVTFSDHATIKASCDHVWTVRTGGRSFDVTTEELSRLVESGYVSVPICNPVEYERDAKENLSLFDIHALILSGRPLPEDMLTSNMRTRGNLVYVFVEIYGIELRGRIAPSEPYDLSGVPESQVWQLVEIASSMGTLATASVDGYKTYHVTILPFASAKQVISVTAIPDEPSKCIAIDNPSHLYLAGRQYTATHNTSLLAGLNLYMLTSDSNERLKECYNAASSEAQARLCYGATDAMVKMSPMLAKRIRRGMVQKRGVSGLNYDATNSYLCTISSNGKKLDGLNTFFAVYDELAICEDGGMIYDLITESMAGEHQTTPQLWIISTENYVRDNIFDERKNYAIGWLDGKIEDDTLLPLIYELDSRDEIYDERAWVKASPGLGITKSYTYLRERLSKALQSPARMPSLLCKEFNLRANAYSSFLDIKYCVNDTQIDFDEIGVPSYVCVGFDLASRNDLCSCVVRWRVPGDDRIYEIAKFWVASEQMNMGTDARQKDRVPYLTWASQGQPMSGTLWHYVDIVEGDRVNQSVVIDFLRELVDAGMYPFCVAYDPWHVDDYTERTLRRLVGENRVYPVPQTARVISPLMRKHELDLKAQKVICPNPCLHHSRSSVQARVDNNDNVFPQKKDLQSHQKIDGFMAELFALGAEEKFFETYTAAIGWEQP